ncbi:MAG TPA: hypothetical protein VGC07_03260 [Granulicella sp.]
MSSSAHPDPHEIASRIRSHYRHAEKIGQSSPPRKPISPWDTFCDEVLIPVGSLLVILALAGIVLWLG